MRLSISKSKNATSLYVIQSIYENGKRSSFFSQVFKTRGISQLSADTARMYLVEKNSSYEGNI